ncbi:MAG: phenylalanine--tRNA ligase subunit beta [Legionellales bacterium]
MKLSMLWLNEWVKSSLTERELASQLTMAGLEVDAVSPVAGTFNKVIVAHVLGTKPHPDADKLTLCEVDAKTGANLQIVCGASNVRPGLKVALAMIGAVLPGDFKIKESKLRGELSQGMLCSLSELGLAEHSEGIMELEADAPLGMDLRDYLNLEDQVLDIDLTPNRADCFSVLGIAREVAVLNKLPLLEPTIDPVIPTTDEVIPVHLKNPEACPRYCGRIIRGINSEAVTPLWIRERLRRGGIRTVHPVVDVMNYVMLELGQPMHAFDLATIKGEINVRFGHENEKLELLDGQEVTLSDKVLVIADKEKALAMAGIMGGAHSAVNADTCDVFLESAFFNPITTAGIARTYGLFSDSSLRYERGVDPCLQAKALERATGLIVSITGGKVGPIIDTVDSNYIPKPVNLSFDTKKVERLTGLNISLEAMKVLLEGLGIVIKSTNNAVFEVSIPSHRFDIQLDVDLVEEIIRLYGYDNLIAQPINSLVQFGKTCANERIGSELATWFSGRGYNETISYSFVDPEIQAELYPGYEFMELLNPISAELSQMRAGLWPGLIASMVYNVHRQRNAVKIFEMGVVFEVCEGQLTERTCIAGLLMGDQGGLNWSETTRVFDFYDLKGDLQSLCSLLKLEDVAFTASTHPALHPGQTAEITVGGNSIGWIGTMHPRLSTALDLQYDVLLFELNLAGLMNPVTPGYKSISKYPQIRRDLSFLVDEAVPAFEIEREVRKVVTENWLKAFDVFDVYTGSGVPEGKKSLAVSMTLQDDNRTLVDAEINLLISAIIKSLENNFSIILRD